MEVDTILNEDCLAGLERIADGTVDLAFADPPFNIGYEYDVYEDREGGGRLSRLVPQMDWRIASRAQG